MESWRLNANSILLRNIDDFFQICLVFPTRGGTSIDIDSLYSLALHLLQNSLWGIPSLLAYIPRRQWAVIIAMRFLKWHLQGSMQILFCIAISMTFSKSVWCFPLYFCQWAEFSWKHLQRNINRHGFLVFFDVASSAKVAGWGILSLLKPSSWFHYPILLLPMSGSICLLLSPVEHQSHVGIHSNLSWW